ncbi:cysteine proteinase [Gonapodya prolifera JEL478]|uniref:Cysteine proteinase n=1 Tax=Gonapodya prolifera (strain JEL478) TaxID=1344416 RepID=A0A138ZYF7_GONPJ|nr:cysteine proteinase [Gonapodya prolifera JEL478]|eukprot:KXS09536.1 cysteine proteinase [Gonapodya prolifera JEL478]
MVTADTVSSFLNRWISSGHKIDQECVPVILAALVKIAQSLQPSTEWPRLPREIYHLTRDVFARSLEIRPLFLTACGFEPNTFFQSVLNGLLQYPGEVDDTLCDESVAGSLDIASTFLQKDCVIVENDTIQIVLRAMFEKLFDPQKLCFKNDYTRSKAFDFMNVTLTRAKDTTGFELICTMLKGFVQASTIPVEWPYIPKNSRRNHFVGLRNLGATCYQNSTLQQLFMVPQFRQLILTADVSGANVTEFFSQLRSLFGFMQLSLRQYCDTQPFFATCTDPDGQPANPIIQMDVDEFFNQTMDRLEHELRGTPMASEIARPFAGKFVQKIRSLDCEHVSESFQPFHTLSVDVKNAHTLEKSIEAFFAGEHLDGDNKYKCDECNKHVDAVKSTSIRHLPPTLIVHLKRFDLDLETMRRTKIHDRFEFPEFIDMIPYTSRGPDETGDPKPLGYRLTGVLVHSGGTADAGHYYSYIRSPKPPREDWFEFNDRSISPFNINHLEDACFGGYDARRVVRDAKEVVVNVPRTRSAYMLFYERHDDPMKMESAVPDPDLLPEIIASVESDNLNLIGDILLFDEGFCLAMNRMIMDMSKTIARDHPTYYNVLDLAWRVLFTVVIRVKTKDNATLEYWFTLLEQLVKNSPHSVPFLKEAFKEDNFRFALLHCPEQHVRGLTSECVIKVLGGVGEYSRSALHSVLEASIISVSHLVHVSVVERGTNFTDLVSLMSRLLDSGGELAANVMFSNHIIRSLAIYTKVELEKRIYRTNEQNRVAEPAPRPTEPAVALIRKLLDFLSPEEIFAGSDDRVEALEDVAELADVSDLSNGRLQFWRLQIVLCQSSTDILQILQIIRRLSNYGGFSEAIVYLALRELSKGTSNPNNLPNYIDEARKWSLVVIAAMGDDVDQEVVQKRNDSIVNLIVHVSPHDPKRSHRALTNL